MNSRHIFLLGAFFAILLTLTRAGLAGEFEELPDFCTLQILTPSLSGRKTAKIELTNGLQAYLVSDSAATQSAAALAISVGSLFDPPHRPGMAHLVEHLFFTGSKDCPEDECFSKWISDYNGKSNAYTLPNRTVYIFSVDHGRFLEAVSRFASNFTASLFSSQGFESEICAIEQEKNDNLEDDRWRFLMVLKEIGNLGHPFSLFSPGGQTTLSDIEQSEVLSWYKAREIA